MCPFRHISGEKTVVCKHWLRGLCKKGDQCEFLHEYDMTKMPECYFYSKFGKARGILGALLRAKPQGPRWLLSGRCISVAPSNLSWFFRKGVLPFSVITSCPCGTSGFGALGDIE